MVGNWLSYFHFISQCVDKYRWQKGNSSPKFHFVVEVSLLVAEPMLARLIGMGKMMVELCSGMRCCRLYNVEQASCYSCWSRRLPAEMELSVWRYRSWSAEGDCWSTSAASFSAFEAFCSPSAAITWAQGAGELRDKEEGGEKKKEVFARRSSGAP